MWPTAPDWSAHRSAAVPTKLMRYTCGFDDHEEYLRGGFEVSTMLNLALKRYTGRLVTEVGQTLDFGCGSGRLATFMRPAGPLHGCDINAKVVAHCQKALPHGTFVRSPLMPPLPYADGQFDLVYSFSVFSHLSLDVERAWLRELQRVGAPGCTYLITVQGDWMIEATLGQDAAAARAAGFTWRVVHERHGSSMDFPDYYESSYHTSDWIRQHWAEHLEILDVLKGDDPGRYLSEGLAFVPSGDVPSLRPMGQDLVVARKVGQRV